MKQMIQIRGSGIRPIEGASPSLNSPYTDFKSATLKQQNFKENHEKLQKILQDTLQDVIENIDESQKKELSILTSKQNEMYTLSQRYSLP